MGTYDLLKALLEKTGAEIEFVLVKLLLLNKIDFMRINNSYIEMLRILNDDKERKLMESNVCVSESFMYDKMKTSEAAKRSIQRRLYLLNQSNAFNMETLNAKYDYNEEAAKDFSWYEREKSI